MFAFWLLALAPITARAADCPTKVVRSAGSPEIPADVCIPNPFTALTIDYFDDYSWKAFVAMVWPAAKGQRGVADATRAVGAPGPRVFETYKSLWEIFHDDGSAPNADFNAAEAGAQNACRAAAGFGGVILASKSGIDDIGQAGIGELAGPVAAQNGRYLRYQTLYNKAMFDAIVANKFYLREHLPPIPSPRPETPVYQFPNGSVAIKAAWLDMAGFSGARRKRFYMRKAVVKDPGTGKCSTVTVGLVGLHIVQKTASRPQWIWSSFEQVDTAPNFQGAVGTFTLNDGTPGSMPAENPLPLVPLAKQPARAFNVVRSAQAPIHFDTSVTNRAYQDLLKGSAWEYYKLIVTQWPLQPGNQAVPVPANKTGEIFNTFPGTGNGTSAKSAFANLSMETFDQGRPELGCMSCHNQARMGADFMWSILDHAYPANLAPAAGAVRGK
ncbi:MAG: hypothetical protein ABI806_19360 [Candidatus Solibacter sp.]